MKKLVYVGDVDALTSGLLARLGASGFAVHQLAPDSGELRFEGERLDYADPAAWETATAGLVPDLVLLSPPWQRSGAMLESSEQGWREALVLNVEGSVYGLQALTRRMIEASRPGHVIALLHVAALKPYRLLGAYGTTLSALVALLGMVAVELAPHGISVNSVATGFSAGGQLNLDEAALAVLEGDTPGGQLVSDAEVFRVIESLLSTGVELTGEVISCDGGHLLTRGRVGTAPFAEV